MMKNLLKLSLAMLLAGAFCACTCPKKDGCCFKQKSCGEAAVEAPAAPAAPAIETAAPAEETPAPAPKKQRRKKAVPAE